MALTRDLILGSKDLPSEAVDVPEWGGVIWVRTLTGKERDAFEQRCQDQKRGDGILIAGLKAQLAALTIVDENGDRLFEDGDADELNTKSAAAIDRVWQVASRLNGLAPGDVEELAGN